MLSKIVQLIQALVCGLWHRYAEPSDGAKSGGSDNKAASDGSGADDDQDSTVEAPPDQTASNDDESVETADATDGDPCRHVPKGIDPGTLGTDASTEPPSYPPTEDTFLPSTQPAKGHEHVQSSSSNSGADSSEESTNEEHGEDVESKAPRKIGGVRDQGSQTSPVLNEDQRIKPRFTRRPELICRKPRGAWRWEVVLSAVEDFNIAEVRHYGKLLDVVNGEFRLSSFVGDLSIAYADRKPDEIPLFDGKPLIFKLRSNWIGDGRRVGGITRGHFILMAPKEWTRTGRIPVEQEKCEDPDFAAHYCFRDKDAAEQAEDGFEECTAALTKSGFELVGERVFDDSEEGELFVGAAPELRCAPGVVWARVGEEEKNGWKGENFKPAEQTLAEVLNGRQGRFFVRVYDDAKLLDSGELRYLRDLREIRVNGEPYSANTMLVPTPTGHSATYLQFVGTDGATIHSNLATDGTLATVQPGGAVFIAPHPEGDDVSCALASGASRVDTVIKLPRIWWRMERDDGDPTEWHDTSLAMTRQEYRNYANTGAAIKLRLPPRITSVNVGFDEELDREYRPPKRGDETELRLADFANYLQIDQRLHADVSLNVQCGEAALTLIRVSADPVPKIISFTSKPKTVAVGEQVTLRWTTQDAEADGIVINPEIGGVDWSGSLELALFKTTTYTLRLTASGMDDVTRTVTVTVTSPLQPGEKPIARVRRVGGGWKPGKGFSYGELRVAGLTAASAARRSIPIDRRRRSTHQANIEMIGGLIDA